MKKQKKIPYILMLVALLTGCAALDAAVPAGQSKLTIPFGKVFQNKAFDEIGGKPKTLVGANLLPAGRHTIWYYKPSGWKDGVRSMTKKEITFDFVSGKSYVLSIAENGPDTIIEENVAPGAANAPAPASAAAPTNAAASAGTGIFALDYPEANWGPKSCTVDAQGAHTPEQVRQAIVETMLAYRWVVESHKDGLIIGSYGKKYPVYVKYDSRHVDIYVNAGKNSQGWAENLRKMLDKKLNSTKK